MKDKLQALLLLAVVTPGSHQLSTGSTACALSEFTSTAQCGGIHRHLICQRGFTGYWLKGIRQEIEYLQIVEWPGDCFNIARLQHYFPGLRTLEFVNSTTLKNFKGRFNSASQIEKISMHGMAALWEVPPNIFFDMQELRELDFRRNMLRHMRTALFNAPRLERVYLGDNLWDCSDGGLDWLAMEQDNGTVKSRISDYYQLVCHQRLYRGKPLHTVMDIIRNMHETCPEPCECVMTHVVSDTSGAVIPLITVDCAGRGLEYPPDILPPSTTTLRLEGNKISSIRSIVHNPLYKKLADLYLDNNSLTAVKELEGTEWFTSFRVLSLRGNKLKHIPVYAFDKALQGNNNIMHVYLGNNPWRCDCHFVPRFQVLLRKYTRVFRDLPHIRCASTNNKHTSLVQISTMPLAIVCTSGKEMPISLINIVNLVLLFLILVVLGRFLYDWHSFKTTGKLPWLSSILP